MGLRDRRAVLQLGGLAAGGELSLVATGILGKTCRYFRRRRARVQRPGRGQMWGLSNNKDPWGWKRGRWEMQRRGGQTLGHRATISSGERRAEAVEVWGGK